MPVTFALIGERVVTCIDHKPKRTALLQRLRNLRSDPRCTLLVDHYDDDWSALWWVRADGHASITNDPGTDHPDVEALMARYAPYRETPPAGPLISVEITKWTGWQATPGQ